MNLSDKSGDFNRERERGPADKENTCRRVSDSDNANGNLSCFTMGGAVYGLGASSADLQSSVETQAQSQDSLIVSVDKGEILKKMTESSNTQQSDN
ncbi:MAG: hypothetical protein V4494_06890 [Chlamydiota bacterium]